MDRVLEEVVVGVDHHRMSGEVGGVDGQEEEEDRLSSLLLVLTVLMTLRVLQVLLVLLMLQELLVLFDRVGWEFALDPLVEVAEALLFRHCSSAWFSSALSLHISHTAHCSWSEKNELSTQYSVYYPK